MENRFFCKNYGLTALLALFLVMMAGMSSARGDEEARKHDPMPEASNVFFGSAGDVRSGFSQFNIDCLDPRSDPNYRQIMHVGPSTNGVFELGWGDWTSPQSRQPIKDCMVKRFIEGKAHGKEMVIATVDFMLFDTREHWADRSKPFQFRGEEVVVPELVKFFSQLEKNGVLDMVKNGSCYIIDEPALYGVSAEALRQAIEALQKAASYFKSLGRCRTYVIYNHGQYPGIELMDMAGQDHYDIGASILGEPYHSAFKRMLRSMDDANPQWMNIVPGGSFGQDPKPFFNKMAEDLQVRLQTSFIAFSGWKSAGGAGGYYRRLFSGRTKAGMGVVGQEELAKEYCHYGKRIINPDVEHPDCETPPPEVVLTVNGEKHITVNVGEGLYYRWDTVYTHEAQSGRTGFTSYWWSSDPQCSYGLNGGMWNARRESGESQAVALSEQAGCTYTITFAALGPGQKNSASAISVTVRGATNPIGRVGRRG